MTGSEFFSCEDEVPNRPMIKARRAPFKVRYNASMSLVILEEGAVPIPADLAQEFGLHKGSSFRWERTDDGALKLLSSVASGGAGSRLLGILKPYVKEQGGGVEAFLKWRDEDARLDGSR